jgi:protocatechuate 3,4-dioxygenase beta subunit
MLPYSLLLNLIILLSACSENQTKQQSSQQVGGRCEGCEAIHESPIPFSNLSHVDTLPGFTDKGQQIEVSGIVYRKDGKTPAKDVVIYVYHTDQQGIYPTKGNETGWGKRHGYIRGWMKTNDKGEYRFYTLRPASYPNSTNPQHIHITIKEPQLNEYWIDDYHFADDPLITADIRRTDGKRGGPGLLQLQMQNGIARAKRNIVLGMSIQDYPAD